MKTCPGCGTPKGNGEARCEVCGAVLTSEDIAPGNTEPTDAAEVTAIGTGPYLVVVSTGDKIPLTKPEIVIGREDPVRNISPDIDTTPIGGLEGGVSRRHAKLTESNGQYSIEDLSSTNYTLVNKEKLRPATPRQLTPGDEIHLGRVALSYRP